jgi:flagellar hook-associated protein 2
MSDLSIPGVTSKYNTQKVIDALMEVERAPLKRMQADVATSQQKKTAWQELTRRLSGLRDGARGLYGFQNPFADKIAGSSDEKVFTASATRTASEETRSIHVRRVATADRFLSAPLPRDFVVAPGEYGFRVGDKEAKLSFRGGSVKEFVDALNSRAGSVVRASIVNDTKSTQVLLIEGTLTGASNRLTFLGASVDLATKAGMLERSLTASRSLALSPATVAAWEKTGAGAWSIAEGALTLPPGGEAKIPVRPSLPLNPNMVLELSVRTERLPEDAVPEVKPPPGPAVPPTGSVEYGGIRILSDPSLAPLPPWTPPPPPPRVNDMQVLFIEADGRLISLPEVADSKDFTKVQVPVGEMAVSLDAIALRNRNTHRRVDVRDIAVFDKTQRGDYVPTRALSQAGDAELEMDGIRVTRPTNAIDDLVPGVTLTLKAAGAAPVDLTVRRDVEKIVEQVLTLVGSYNRAITDIDVLTRKDVTVIDAAGYLTDEERKKAGESLGLLVGDLSLSQLKSAMQTTMMNPYPTSRGRDLALLAQIGISTDTRAPGSGGIDKARLRGYLEVDEAKLTDAVQRWPDAVKDLFGSDTDGDLAVNAGAAFSLDTLLRSYVATGGILPQRMTTLDRAIADKNREITAYNRHLDDYLAQLKRKYGQMEGALGTLEKNSQAIQNFNRQNTPNP